MTASKSKKNKYEIDMCNGTVLDKLISFSIPLMLSSILQLLFNAVDIVVVGRFSGSRALAAVGSTTALINVFTNLFIGVSLGANVLAARFYATKQEKQMSETVHTAVTFALISGIVMVFVGLFFSKAALLLMDTPSDVIGQSALYMRIYFAGMPFFMLYNYGAAILRAVGDTKRPLFFLIIAGIVNAALNLFLVIVLHLGVAGVAIATVIAQMISCLLVLRCLYRSDGSYQLRFSAMTIKWIYLKQIFQVGIPAGIQSTVINFSNVLLQSSVNSFGSIAMAGYTAANNIFGFLYAAANSITQACMSFTSQNYGAGRPDRVKKSYFISLGYSFGVGLVLGAALFFCGPSFLALFTTETAVIDAGMKRVAVMAFAYCVSAFMDCTIAASRGLGKTVVPTVIVVLGSCVFRVIWVYTIFAHFHTIPALYLLYPCSWILTALAEIAYFASCYKRAMAIFRKPAAA